MTQTQEHNVPTLRFPEFSEEWSTQKLGDVGPVSMCKRILKRQTKPTGDVPFYKIGTFGRTPDAFIDRALFEDCRGKYSFPRCGDILISAAGTIGRLVVYDDKPAYFQDSNIVWVANNESRVGNQFLFYCYENVRWTTENTTIARLYNENLRSIKLTVPPLPEQQKIASFLTSVDRKIEQLGEKKALLQRYKKGMMQKLFSQEIRFKDDRPSDASQSGGRFGASASRPQNKANDFPDWEEKRLGEISTTFSGGTPSSSNKAYYSGDIPFIGSGNIGAENVNQYITDEALRNSSAKMVERGDLLYALYGATSGEVAISKINGAINQAILCIRSNEMLEYLYQFLLFKKGRILATFLQGGQGNLSAQIIKNLKVNLPSKTEQQKIADFLSAIDQKIDLATTELNHAKAFKKGLLQQMFV